MFRTLTALASHKGYEMEFNRSVFEGAPSGSDRLSLDEIGDGLRRVSKQFAWLREDEECLANLVCSGLDGEGLWAEYGLSVGKGRSGGEGPQRVTRDGVLYQVVLAPAAAAAEEDVLTVSAWMAEGAGAFGPIRCFLWCGSPETVPEPQVSPAEAEVIDHLVRLA